VYQLLLEKGLHRLTEPAESQRPMRFVELYLSYVKQFDFRRNPRGEHPVEIVLRLIALE
jgi:hypothetical protein